ncbi:site-specific integrase [bacterium]|nr:site-specific integrase [bacterium]
MASIRKRAASFEARAHHNGQVYSRSFQSQQEANRWAYGVELGFIDPSRSRGVESGSLAEAADRYAVEVSSKHKGAVQEHQRIRQIKKLRFAHKPLPRVRPDDLKRLRDDMLRAGRSTSTVRLLLSLISAIYKHAQREWGVLTSNPVSALKMPRPPAPRNRRINAAEEVLLKEAIKRCRNPSIQALVLFALETGMRRSEMLNLRWEDIDLPRRVATLPDTKNGRPRWVPLTPRALELLEEQSTRGCTVPFDMSATAVSQAWRHIVVRAGLSNLRFHDLRHEALSRWAHRLQGDVFKLSLVSGHRTLQMAQRYVHPVQSEFLASLNMSQNVIS